MHALFPLETERVTLILAQPAEAQRVVAYRNKNREHLRPWEPSRPAGYDTLENWSSRLHTFEREFVSNTALSVLITPKQGSSGRATPVIGQIGLTNIIRGPFQAAFLGYELDLSYQGRGMMHEALEAILTLAFESLNLHRVMANYRPENTRSASLLKRLGFIAEGLARDYLYIDGAWRDHVLTALIQPTH